MIYRLFYFYVVSVEPEVITVGLTAGVVTAGVLLVLVIVIVITCCTLWCRNNKTDRLNNVCDLVIHFNCKRANPQIVIGLKEIADSHERANEDLHNIPDQDYEVITSDNEAYQAAIKPGRDNLHLVSNVAYAVGANPRHKDHEYMYVDENYVTEIGTQGEENKVNTSLALEEIADSHERANEGFLDIPDQDYEVITSDNDAYQAASRPSRDNVHLVSNEAYAISCPISADPENEVTTFANVAYEGVNRHIQDDLCLDSNAAYNIMPQI